MANDNKLVNLADLKAAFDEVNDKAGVVSVNGQTGAVSITPANIGAFGKNSIGTITDANNINLYGSGLYKASACANLPTNDVGVYYQVEFFGTCQMAYRHTANGIDQTWARHYTNSKWYPWVRIDKVTGVKGNAESSYRTGDVNLTPANIGAHPANTDLQVTNDSSYTGTPAAVIYKAVAEILDSSDFIRHQMYGIYNTDESFYTYINARRPNGSSAVTNNIAIGFDASGNAAYKVSEPAAFRSAIGLEFGSTRNPKTVNDTALIGTFFSQGSACTGLPTSDSRYYSIAAFGVYQIAVRYTSNALDGIFTRFYVDGRWHAWTNSPMPGGWLPNGTNIDAVNTPGTYGISASNTYDGLPSGVTSGILEVIAPTAPYDTYTIQRLNVGGTPIYQRYRAYDGGTSYGSWYRYSGTEVN